MSEEEENKVQKSLDRIETSLIGDFDNKGLISKVHENTDRSKSNSKKLDGKAAKELALAISIILIMAGIIMDLLK